MPARTFVLGTAFVLVFLLLPALYGQDGYVPTAQVVARPELRSQQGNGIGYRGGYTVLGGLFPLGQEAEQFVILGDGRLIMDNQGNVGGNVGGGSRWFLPSLDRTIGAFAYFDVRDTTLGLFEQFSGGVESLGTLLDVRANWYIPTGDRQARDSTFIWNGGAPFLAGRRILAPGIQRVEQAFTGTDFEIGGPLPFFQDLIAARGYIGGYYFRGSNAPDAVGVRARIDCQFTDYAAANIAMQSDRVFGTNAQVGVAFSFGPGQKARRTGPVNPSQRLGEPVQRLDLIVLQKQSLAGSFALRNPATGREIDVVHVDANAPDGGDGTVERPVNNLGDAEELARKHSIIFVNDGIYFRRIQLDDHQRLLGAGVPHLVPTIEAGTILFPKIVPGAQPTIFAVGSIAVEVDDNTEVAGMFIDGNGGGTGIFGDRSDNVNINRNVIRNTQLEGIKIEESKGRLTIVDNTLENIGDDAIQIDLENGDTMNILIARNTILNTVDEAIQIGTEDSSNVNVIIRNNQITGSGDSAIRIDHFSFGTFNANIFNNTLVNNGTSNDEAGVQLEARFSRLNATINNNVFTMNDADVEGVRALARDNGIVNVRVLNNQFGGTYDSAVQLSNANNGSLTGLVSGNTIAGTLAAGVRIDPQGSAAASFLAEVVGNTITHASQGIQVVAGNQAAATLNLSNNTITGTVAGTGQGIQFQTTGNSNVTAVINNNLFTGLYFEGIDFAMNSNAAVTATLAGNTWQGTYTRGIDTNIRDNANLTLNLSGGNLMQGTYNAGIRVRGREATVTNLTSNGTTFLGTYVNGIFTNATEGFQNTSQFTANLVNNQFGGSFTTAILLANDSLTTTGNVLGTFSGNSMAGTFTRGIDLIADGGATPYRFSVTSNTVAAAAQEAYRFRSDSGDLCLRFLSNVGSTTGPNVAQFNQAGGVFTYDNPSVGLLTVGLVTTDNPGLVGGISILGAPVTGPCFP